MKKKVMIFSTDAKLEKALEYLRKKEPYYEFCVGTDQPHSLRFIEYHLQEFDMVLMDLEMISFELILNEVLERNYGDGLKIPMVILLPKENISKQEVSDKLAIGTGVEYEKVNYTTVSWLSDLLRKL